jgi:hypothetical protein
MLARGVTSIKLNLYDTSTSSICERPTTPTQMSNVQPWRFKTYLLAIGVWQFTALAMMIIYGNVIGHVVLAAYTWLYGDIQSSYGRFARLSTYAGLLVITLPASVAAIVIVDKLSSSKCTIKEKVLLAGCWQSAAMISLAVSYEFGFPYMLNQLGWRIFGPPTEIYSFQNLLLDRIVACLICTVPISVLAVWFWSRLCAHSRGTID